MIDLEANHDIAEAFAYEPGRMLLVASSAFLRSEMSRVTPTIASGVITCGCRCSSKLLFFN